MKNRIAALATVAALGLGTLASPAMAEPGGCLKYGAVGAVGGHMAHHGVLGAVGGCATGMMVRHHARQQARMNAASQQGYGTPDGGQSGYTAPSRY